MTAAALGNSFRQFFERESLRPDLARATRATAGFMIPLALQATVGLPVEVVFACITAQSIAMLDVRGDYRLRISLLVVMTVLLATTGVLGALASVALPAAVAATMVVALGAGLWRHLGSDYGAPIAAASMLLFLISLSRSHGPADAVPHVLAILFGGGIGLAIQMLLWPLRPQHPLRRAVSDSWVAAGALFATLQPGGRPEAIGEAEAALRTALDQANRILAGVVKRHRTPLPARLEALNLRAARLAVRIGAVHTALDGLRGSPMHRQIAPALGAVLTSLINTSRSIAVTVVSRQPAHLAACEVRLRRLDALLEALQARLAGVAGQPGAAQLAPLLEGVRETVPDIAETLRATLDRAGERALFTVELFDVDTWQLKPLASALNFTRNIDCSLVRFGLRMAVFTGLGTLIFLWLKIPHGYWLPFTIVVVMQPDFGSTRQKALQRVGGTLAGSVIASLLLWLDLPPAAHLFIIGFGVFAFAYFLKRSYGVAVVFVTIFVVMLLEHAGQGGSHVEIERIGATLVGGLIALLAAQLFWPVWERDRFPPIFARALSSTRDYLAVLQSRLHDGGGLDDATVKAKRRAEAAAALMFSSLGRLFADTHAPRAEVEKIAALANGNQRTLRIANLLMVGLHDGPALDTPVISAHFKAIERTLQHLADHAANPAKVKSFELAARAADLDTLPPVPSDAPEPETRVTGHLARAATEVRAMLAAATATR
ncbi:MAG: FUSC family protein [Opitutaceae bacterium]|jgi:uncharacterized membrane protein YccC